MWRLEIRKHKTLFVVLKMLLESFILWLEINPVNIFNQLLQQDEQKCFSPQLKAPSPFLSSGSRVLSDFWRALWHIKSDSVVDIILSC